MDKIDEAELVGAGRSGAVVDGAAGDDRRAALAALLRRCCHELRDQIDPRGLRLRNVGAGRLGRQEAPRTGTSCRAHRGRAAGSGRPDDVGCLAPGIHTTNTRSPMTS